MSHPSDMENNQDQNGLLRISEAARWLAVSTRTIWRMISKGELTPIRVRGATRVLWPEVAKYLKPLKQKPSHD